MEAVRYSEVIVHLNRQGRADKGRVLVELCQNRSTNVQWVSVQDLHRYSSMVQNQSTIFSICVGDRFIYRDNCNQLIGRIELLRKGSAVIPRRNLFGSPKKNVSKGEDIVMQDVEQWPLFSKSKGGSAPSNKPGPSLKTTNDSSGALLIG